MNAGNLLDTTTFFDALGMVILVATLVIEGAILLATLLACLLLLGGAYSAGLIRGYRRGRRRARSADERSECDEADPPYFEEFGSDSAENDLSATRPVVVASLIGNN